MAKKEKAPPGGWLGAPPSDGIAPLKVMNKKGRMVPVELTRKEKEERKEWQRRIEKADAKGVWRFRWPPKN